MLATRVRDRLAPRLQILAIPRARAGLAFLSVTALFCLSLEIELPQRIDSLHRYLTAGEIALEAGIALLLSLAISCAWWLIVLLIGKLAGALSLPTRIRIPLQWYFWIATPASYAIFEIFEDFRLELRPQWHASGSIQVLAGLGLILLCFYCFYRVSLPTLQSFCRIRLAPMGWGHIVLALVAALALWFHGVRPFHNYAHPGRAIAASNLPDIYLITIDTLRGQGTSVYGYERPTTPNLLKFAGRSSTFDYHFANSNFTTPTTVTIETGKLPWSHRVFQLDGFLRRPAQPENLAAVLRQRGYYTAMISSNFVAAPFHHRTLASYDAVEYAAPLGLSGLQLRYTNLLGVNSQSTLAFSLVRGLSTLNSYFDLLILRDRYPSPAEPVFDRARTLLGRSDRSQPIFLWTHILPPHSPYRVPAPYRHHFVSEDMKPYDDFLLPRPDGRPGPGATVQQWRALYDEMVLYADHAVGEFLDWLDRTGRLDRAIVIISADHGELFDHNRLGHGGPDLYNGVIRIPLMIHLPGQTRGARISEISQQADLLPTVLDLVGTQAVNWCDGTSLKPALEGKPLPHRYIFSMNLEPDRIFDPISKGTVAVMDGEFKYVDYLSSQREELYRYKVDVNERSNLIASEADVAKRMRDVLLGKLGEVNQRFAGK